MDFKHYNTMLELLESNLESYLINDLAISFLKHEVDDTPPILLNCSSCPISLAFIRKLVANLHHLENVPKLEKGAFEGLQSNAYMFHFNVSNRKSREIFDFITNLVEQKSPQGKRHVVIFNIVEILRHSVALGVKSIIGKWSANALFVIRNDNGYYIHESIRAMCQSIRLQINTSAFVKDFEQAINIPIPVNEKDPMNICIALEGVAPMDMFQHFVYSHMDKLAKLSDGLYNKALRDFCIRIGASCVPIATLSMHILSWIKTNNIDIDVISILARMDHSCITTIKSLFTLELEIDRIIKMIQ